jgi:hypothetical protein
MHALHSSFHQQPRASRFAVIALSTLLPLLFAGCTETTSITTHAAGHEITADIEGTPSVENEPTRAVIGGPFGTVTIERERVRLDDLQWTTIQADVPVWVSIRRHKVRVKAGRVTIARTTSG